MADKRFPDFSKEDFEVVDADLTPEEEMAAARVAEEVLPKFRQRAGLIPGGKSLSGDATKRSPVVQVVLSQDHRDQLAAEAKDAGMSVSKFARRLIEEHLEHRAS